MPDTGYTAAIDVVGLSKSYPVHGKVVHAVDDVSFCVSPGSTTGLLGGNGAGKTTTIAMLLGILLPTSGTIRLLGCDMIADRHAVLPRVNFSSPYVDLPGRLNAYENFVVYGKLYGVRNIPDHIDVLARQLDLLPFLRRPVGRLSAGQKTRVALAKALLNTPDVLLLDEPTASLDPDTGDRIRSVLEDYRRQTGATLFLASHNMAEVERLCDNVLMMRDGRIQDQGRPEDLLSRYGRSTLEDVFLDIARSRVCEGGRVS